MDNTRDYARVSHSRQWSNYNITCCCDRLTIPAVYTRTRTWLCVLGDVDTEVHAIFTFRRWWRTRQTRCSMVALWRRTNRTPYCLTCTLTIKPIQLWTSTWVTGYRVSGLLGQRFWPGLELVTGQKFNSVFKSGFKGTEEAILPKMPKVTLFALCVIIIIIYLDQATWPICICKFNDGSQNPLSTVD